MPAIRSVIRIEGASETGVSDLLSKLKRIEDVPYDNVSIEPSSNGVKLSISYPLDVFDGSAAQFMTVLFGELAFMRSFGELTFLDLELPAQAYAWFGGPKFGVEGIRKRFGVKEYPMLMSIIKPSVGPGLSIAAIDEKISSVLDNGFHAVKDDEMQGDSVYAPLKERLHLASKYPHYVPALNLDSVEEFESALSGKEPGMILVNASTIGFPMLNALSKRIKVPILSHVAMQGTYQKTFSPKVFALLHRLFGCDAFTAPIGDVDYFCIDKKGERDMVEAFTSPLPIKGTMPMLTGGARLNNLEEIILPYEKSGVPYGAVFGTQVYVSDEPPGTMAAKIVQKVKEIKRRK